MIAAAARRTKATLLTRDAQIVSSGVVATVWQGLNRSACLRALIARSNFVMRDTGVKILKALMKKRGW